MGDVKVTHPKQEQRLMSYVIILSIQEAVIAYGMVFVGGVLFDRWVLKLQSNH